MTIVSILFATSLVLICLIIPSSASRFIIPVNAVNAQTDIGSNNTTNTTNTVVQQWKTYSDKKLGISLQYPSNWVVKQKTNRFESEPELTIEGAGGANSFSVIMSPMEGMGDAKLFAEYIL